MRPGFPSIGGMLVLIACSCTLFTQNARAEHEDDLWNPGPPLQFQLSANLRDRFVAAMRANPAHKDFDFNKFESGLREAYKMGADMGDDIKREYYENFLEEQLAGIKLRDQKPVLAALVALFSNDHQTEIYQVTKDRLDHLKEIYEEDRALAGIQHSRGYPPLRLAPGDVRAEQAANAAVTADLAREDNAVGNARDLESKLNAAVREANRNPLAWFRNFHRVSSLRTLLASADNRVEVTRKQLGEARDRAQSILDSADARALAKRKAEQNREDELDAKAFP